MYHVKNFSALLFTNNFGWEKPTCWHSNLTIIKRYHRNWWTYFDPQWTEDRLRQGRLDLLSHVIGYINFIRENLLNLVDQGNLDLAINSGEYLKNIIDNDKFSKPIIFAYFCLSSAKKQWHRFLWFWR